MSAAALALHQLRFDQKMFWRNPASVFFTVMLPVVFLAIFSLLFSGDEVRVGASTISVETYYVPAITTLGVISATLVNLAINLTRAREAGDLKRMRGTPVPTWVVFAGRIGNSIVLSLLMLALVSAIGAIVFGVDVPWEHLPTILITLVIGAASFCALGIALTRVIPSADAAPAVTNFCVLPLYFLSGVFIPQNEIPDGVLDFAGIFPIRHFFLALFSSYDPAVTGTAIQWGDLAIVAAWGIAGLLLATRFFRWTPRGT
jgi:ABC-2 type transport system permease protein